jgi:ABC-type transport system involved in multi-copper enzyme maturation permease subunit
MKALAIFNDSLREAIDSKVFYVMIALSGLVILLTATLTFKPQPPGELMRSMIAMSLRGDPGDLGADSLRMGMPAAGPRTYDVLGAEPLDGAADGPDTTYRFTVSVQRATEADRLGPGETEQLLRDRFGVFDQLRIFHVLNVRPARPGEQSVPEKPARNQVFFSVTAQPTPDARRMWPHEPGLFFGAVPLAFSDGLPLGLQLWILEDQIIAGFGAWVTILVSVIITAFFIPNMLRKGTIDLLLVKPIHRATLLLYKYLGGLLFIFLNTALVVVGMWAAIGWRSGIWAPSFLLLIPTITFFFAILYSVSALFAVRTRSAVAAILATGGAWFIFFLVGAVYQQVEQLRQKEERNGVPLAERSSEGIFGATVNAVHYVLPRTKDLDHLTGMLLMRDLLTANQVRIQELDQTRTHWGETLLVSTAFIVLMLGLAYWRFARTGY